MWVGVEVERKVSEKWTRDVFISSGCQGKLKAQKKDRAITIYILQ